MKIIVDKLPVKKEDCLFCFVNSLDKYNSHKCFFKMSEYEFGDGLHCSYNDCFLSQGLKCPYLKELFSQEEERERMRDELDYVHVYVDQSNQKNRKIAEILMED